jgi:hypothetical protein
MIREIHAAEPTSVTCPKCGSKFPLTAALTQQIGARIRGELEAELRQEAEQSAQNKLGFELQAVREQLSIKETLLRKAQEAELKLRRERTLVEEREKNLDLELARRADEVGRKKDEEYRLREAEAGKLRDDLKRQVDELRRKVEQRSQQAQGEALELDLEAALRRAFPFDDVQPVAKGAPGGDVVQLVRDERGGACGAILWETKRTKHWVDGWVLKLKDDALAGKAQLAVLVSTALPKEVRGFEMRDGVWLSSPELAIQLAAALRLSLLEAAAARRAIAGRQDKMAAVYGYLASAEFKARVAAIVDTFRTMREDLEDEKRALQKIWSKREKQIERVVANTAGLHGDLQGIIGRELPAIDALELPGEHA